MGAVTKAIPKILSSGGGFCVVLNGPLVVVVVVVAAVVDGDYIRFETNLEHIKCYIVVIIFIICY